MERGRVRPKKKMNPWRGLIDGCRARDKDPTADGSGVLLMNRDTFGRPFYFFVFVFFFLLLVFLFFALYALQLVH